MKFVNSAKPGLEYQLSVASLVKVSGAEVLTSLQQRLVKTGGRLVKHACYWLLLAEGHLTRRVFAAILRRIWALGTVGYLVRSDLEGVPPTSHGYWPGLRRRAAKTWSQSRRLLLLVIVSSQMEIQVI